MTVPNWQRRLITIDPGKTTGMAAVDIGYNPDRRTPQTGHYVIERIATRDVPFDLAPAAVEAFIRTHDLPGKPTFIECEHFTLTRTSTAAQATWSLEVTGMARMIAAQLGIPFNTSQQPAQIKTFAPRAVLYELGLIVTPPESQHRIDALSHAVIHTARLRKVAPNPLQRPLYDHNEQTRDTDE